MLDRLDRSVRLALLTPAGDAVLIAAGIAGEAVVTASHAPTLLVVPFRWLGQFGTVLVMVGVFTVGPKAVLEFA